MPIEGIFLSASVKLLFEKMSSFASSKLPTFEGIGTQLSNWTNMLRQIEALLVDAEEKQLTDRAVNLWLDDLQDLAYDLDDLVDEFATEALRQSLKAKLPQASSSKVWNPIPNFKPRDVVFNFKMRSKIEGINTRLHNSFEQCSKLNLVKIVGTTTPPKTWQKPKSTSLLKEPRVYGREKDQRKIIELLVGGGESSRNKVDVIPIVGMGGIGKTTLAQMVYNDEIVKNHFDLKAWVCVSDEFDILKITKAIYDSVTSQTCSSDNLDQAQVQLKQALAGKKFFIVLDDVWNKKYNDWNDLNSPFKDGAQGSKVVVTTRSRDVARMMATVELHDVEILSDEDCWSLFAQHAFENRGIDANPNLVSIGKKIVEKCKGLPLAAKTLSGLLRCKERDEEWKCFAYCSIIPNDYEFEEEEIVLLWMAEGFIMQKREKQMEDVGGDYFRELLSRSFFQPSSTIARDTCFRLDDKLKDQEQYRNLKKARHSSYMQETDEGMKKFEIFDKAMHLRTFLPFGSKHRWNCYLASNVVTAREANLNDTNALDVLSMEWSVNSDDSRDGRVETEVLDMLQPHKNLKELHIKGYLGTRFPTWIGDALFSNMTDISLDNCGNCASLPPLGQLPSLKKLYITGMSALKHIGCEFYGQVGVQPFPLLKTLSFKNMPEWEDWYTFGDHKEVQPFTRVKSLSIIKCPKLLKMLPTDLPCLNNLEIRDCPKLCGMMPKDLPCLNNLNISECPQFLVEGSSISLPSLTSIAMNDVPLTSLQAVLEMRSMADDELISANAKSKHPSSITSLSIGMIKKLELSPIWVTHGLMELEALEITSCEELKTLWKNEERVQQSLPAFRRLKIEGCPQLVSLFEEDEDEDNKGQHEQQQQQQQEGLPCIVRRLEHLTIDNCEKLEKLPRLLHNFTFLGELFVYECPSLDSFPETGFPCTLKILRIYDCEALQSLFGCLTHINDSNLQVLDVRDCPSLTSLISCRGGGLPPTLKELGIWRCKKLEALLVVEEGMEITCPSLESVWIIHCDRLKYLPDVLPNNNNNLRNLSQLYLCGCKNLEYIPEGWFHSATNLRDLEIRGCKKLKALPHGLQSINYLTFLQSLEMNISEWNNNFKEIDLHSLSSLTTLLIEEEEEEGVAGSSFPIDGKLLPTSLIILQIGGFRNLEKLSSKLFQNLASLEYLQIWGCPRLKSLPVQRLPPLLKKLLINGSRKLTRKCEKGKGKYWPHLAHIPDVDVC
ncbi:unnamed protein product [Camellia sinensis]